MRRIVLLNSTVLLLLSAGWAAQDGRDLNSENKNSSRMTIEGCLDGAIGNYTLTDNRGASYRLTGNPEQLKVHVGDTMRVTGVVTPVVNLPGAVSQGAETLPTLSIISLKQVSTVCSDANDIP